jgi:hypothetical protein
VNIGDDADNFAPLVIDADTDSLAERGGGVRPINTREIFGNERNGNLVVEIAPRKVTACDKRRA